MITIDIFCTCTAQWVCDDTGEIVRAVEPADLPGKGKGKRGKKAMVLNPTNQWSIALLLGHPVKRVAESIDV
jgi:hypothetical protein